MSALNNSVSRGIRAADLAGRLGGELVGDGTRLLTGVATLEQAGPESLSWVGSAEHLPRLAASRAGVFLIPAGCTVESGRTVIRVNDPDLALCEALRLLGPQPAQVPPGVHPTAIVSPGARIEGAALGAHVFIGADAHVGAGTQLHPGVYVGAESVIGGDCVLWPNVVVRERCTIGDRVIIHPNATIGADGFGYLQRGGRNVKIPQMGTVVVEDDVEIGAGSAVDRARSGETRVRRGTKIDNLVQIGHNCDIGENCVIVAQCGISGSTKLGHHVVLGGQVGLIDHLCIGSAVQVAAQSGVYRDMPDGAVWRGTPATDNNLYLRQQVALRKLPKLLEEFRALIKRIEKLESATNDPEHGRA